MNNCPREGGLIPSDPHIQLMCGLYQAFYGSYLPIAADQPFLCLLRHLIKTAVPDLARQLRLAARVHEVAYAAMCLNKSASSSCAVAVEQTVQQIQTPAEHTGLQSV